MNIDKKQPKGETMAQKARSPSDDIFAMVWGRLAAPECATRRRAAHLWDLSLHGHGKSPAEDRNASHLREIHQAVRRV